MVRHQYERLSGLYAKAYPGKKVMDVQELLNKGWSKVKGGQVLYEDLVRDLKARIQRREDRASTLWKSFSFQPVKKRRVVQEEPPVKVEEKKVVKEEKKVEVTNVISSPPAAAPRCSPRQEALKAEIARYSIEIDALKVFISGLNPSIEHRKSLQMLLNKQKKCMSALKRCKSLQRASRKHRKKVAKILMENAKQPTRPFPGRPPLEDFDEFKALPDLIVRVAQQYAAADPRRRAEVLTLPSSLDDLQAALKKEGLEIKRATLYTRLIPRRKNSSHGRRHINVVPVKLRRPQYDGRKTHISARFCFTVDKMLRELAS